MKSSLYKYFFILIIFMVPSWALADEEPTATPSRPTVASGAAISEPGWLEAEFGIQQTKDSADKRGSLPYLFKYSVNDNWAVWLGGEAYIRDDAEGVVERGFGDTSLTLKHKFDLGGSIHSAGFEVTAKLPTADDDKGLGSGRSDYTLRGIYGIDLPAGFHLDANLAATHLGISDPGTGQTAYLLAAAVAHALGERASLMADLSTTLQRGTTASSQLMLAANYACSNRIVVDAGMQFGISRNSPDWTAFAGITMLLGKLGQ